MGNYRGKVRCTVCYQTGHNKRTCPKQTERLTNILEAHQKRLAAAVDSVHAKMFERQIDEVAHRIAKRTGVNPVTGETLAKGKRGPVRRCSYCKSKNRDISVGQGHTRRTCETLKLDIEQAHKINRAYRVGARESLRASQVGLGTLIKKNSSGYYNGEWARRAAVFMVQSIEWSEVAYTQPQHAVLRLKRTDCLGDPTEGIDAITLPDSAVVVEGERVKRQFNPADGTWMSNGRGMYGGWDPAAENVGYGAHLLLSSYQPPFWVAG